MRKKPGPGIVARRAGLGQALELPRMAVCMMAACLIVSVASPALAGGGVLGDAGPRIAQSLRRFRTNLEALGRAMGAKDIPDKEFPAENPDRRDVYDILLTLYGKTDKLAYEQTGTRGDFFSNVNVAAISPQDILNLAENAGKRLDQVLARHGLTPVAAGAPASPANAAGSEDSGDAGTAVYRKAVALNKRLNRLLANKTTPADIYRQLTWAVNSSREILAVFPEAAKVEEPPLRQGKTPAEVYTALIHIFRVISDILRTSGFMAMEIPYAVLDDVTSITVDDVYDLATVLASQLAFLRSRLKHRNLMPGVYYPGPKTMDDDYQLAGLLKAYADELYFNIVDASWLR